MAKTKKKVFRHKLNFSRADLAGRVQLGASGISMPMLASDELDEYRKSFSRQRDSLNFGMFGNDPKYYDGLRGDVKPKPEDYLEVPFRLISATVVGGGSWKATDFSNAKVLKKSTPLLDGVPLYKDHETDLNNWSGLVNGVKWTKSFTQDDGIVVPAGIDGIVAIDTVVDPKLARGVISGAVYSNSVTVEFDWEMSHDFENEWDFLNKLGTIGSDGKMVRRMVKDIHNYHESSLVWLGADPFAKAIDVNGNHKNIDVSSVFNYAKQSFSKSNKIDLTQEEERPETEDGYKSMTVNFAVDQNVLSLARRTKTQLQNKNTKDMEKFIAAFILSFGAQFNLKEGDKPTDEDMVSYMKHLSFVKPEEALANKTALSEFAVVKSKALEVFKAEDEANKDAESVDMVSFMDTHQWIGTPALDALNTSVTDLTAEKETLETKVASLAADAKIGKEFIGMKQSEAIRLYKLSVGEGNESDSVITMFKAAEPDAIEGLLKQYTKNATHKFSGTCADCGSADFKFQSSFTSGKDEDGVKEVEPVTTDAIHAKFSQPSMNIGRNRGE